MHAGNLLFASVSLLCYSYAGSILQMGQGRLGVKSEAKTLHLPLIAVVPLSKVLKLCVMTSLQFYINT